MSELPLTLFIVIRKDLVKQLKWPIGSVITQACHATSAILHETRDDSITKAYLDNIDKMHKVTLETKSEITFANLCTKLKEASISHRVWIEQPENIPTCVAIGPAKREGVLKDILKSCQLWRD